MKKKSISIFLVFLVSAIIGASEPETETIAVASLKPTGMTEEDALILTDILRTELGKTLKYDVMERSRMDEILNEQGFQNTGSCSESSCAVEIGQLLGVKHMVLGGAGKLGKTYTLNARIVDIRTGSIVTEVTEYYKGTKDALITKTIPVVAKKLTGIMVTRPSKAKKIVLFSTLGVVAAAAIAVPVYIFSTKEDAENQGSSANW